MFYSHRLKLLLAANLIAACFILGNPRKERKALQQGTLGKLLLFWDDFAATVPADGFSTCGGPGAHVRYCREGGEAATGGAGPTMISEIPTVSEISTSSFWARLDAVMVINLDCRPERWEEAKSQLLRFVPGEKLHRVSAVLGNTLSGFGNRPWFRGRKRDETWAARGGCALSHRKALQMARDSGWETVLVLEDDVAFDNAFDALSVGISRRLFEGPRDWHLCYLGFTDPLPPYQKVADLGEGAGLFRVFGCNTAHAYLVSAGLRDWLLEHLPTEENVWAWLSRNRAVDRWYMQTLGKRFSVLCISPSKVNQTPGFSDIAGRATDYSIENQHHLAIPDELAAKPFFCARYRLRKVSLGISRIFDYLKGWLKSLTGF